MGTRLYVGNLSFDTTEDTLRGALSADGRGVKSVHIVTGGNGRPRGFAFAEMESETEAQAAIAALEGTELNGRVIKVNEEHDRNARSSGPRESGGFRPGGGSRGKRRGGR